MDVINLQQKLKSFDSFWDPKVVAELNDQYVKLAKLKGKFVWHRHPLEDELFFVLKGKLQIELRDRVVDLSDGEMFVVPRNVEHRPIAHDEVHVLLFEPMSTRNTGTVDDELTVEHPEKI